MIQEMWWRCILFIEGVYWESEGGVCGSVETALINCISSHHSSWAGTLDDSQGWMFLTILFFLFFFWHLKTFYHFVLNI